MNLLCDEGIERQIVDALRNARHSVVYVADLDPGIPDHEVLSRASATSSPRITNDKDFGGLVFRQKLSSAGVMLLRLEGLSNATKASIVVAAVEAHGHELVGSFVVVSPSQVRIRRGIV